jgi:hypothetical protein
MMLFCSRCEDELTQGYVLVSDGKYCARCFKIVNEDRELYPAGTHKQIECVVREIAGTKTDDPIAGLEWALQAHRGQVNKLEAQAAELDALRAQVEAQEKELAHWKVREKQWQGVADLGKSIEKVKAENSRQWHEKNTARIDELETARDLALAKAETYKRSRDDWMRRFRLRAGKTIELRRENKQLRDALDVIRRHAIRGWNGYDFDKVQAFVHMAQTAEAVSAPEGDVSAIPFESDDESGHAPDGLTPLSARDLVSLCEEKPKRVRPFSNGTQFMDWENANCSRCKKYSEDASSCDLVTALTFAYFDDGTISAEHAQRIGYDSGAYSWMCGEVEWTDEWIADCEAKERAESAANTTQGNEQD